MQRFNTMSIKTAQLGSAVLFFSKHGRHIQSHLGMAATHGCTYELTINAEMLSARMKEASFFEAERLRPQMRSL